MSNKLDESFGQFRRVTEIEIVGGDESLIENLRAIPKVSIVESQQGKLHSVSAVIEDPALESRVRKLAESRGANADLSRVVFVK